jgi:hypothetical protein
MTLDDNKTLSLQQFLQVVQNHSALLDVSYVTNTSSPNSICHSITVIRRDLHNVWRDDELSP